MPRSLPEACSHIVEAIARIRAWHGGRDVMALRADAMRMMAIERALEIISEASRSIPEQARSLHPHIPWRQIEDIGNWFRHGYDVIDAAVVIRTIHEDLEPLRLAVRDISPIYLPDIEP